MDFILAIISEINTVIKNIVWGPIMLTLLIGAGLYLSIRTGFIQFTRFTFSIKHTIGSLFQKKHHKKDYAGISPFQAVATAMAGTIGTGSISGIATAIVAGGPGAVFWMWVSALLGMVTKYSEILLSLTYREKSKSGEWVGGPMYYIKNGLKYKPLAKTLAFFFALFAMAACLGTGNATQSNAIALALNSTLHISPIITGILLTLLVSAVILGGMRRISSVNEKLVPFMAIFYVLCALIAVVVNFTKIPAAFSLIFQEAFNFRAAFGGVAGYGIMRAMQIGFARGVFSNEAGLGSAPIAHAASSAKQPVDQAIWGMFEVFFTTIIICTLSALTILTSGLYSSGLDGAALSIAAFDSLLPGIGSIVVALATIFFALSTILGWAYYGEVSARFLTNDSKLAVWIYRIIYVATVLVGAVGSLDLIWSISDTMNGLMAIPNLIGLITLSGVVVKETTRYFSKK